MAVRTRQGRRRLVVGGDGSGRPRRDSAGHVGRRPPCAAEPESAPPMRSGSRRIGPAVPARPLPRCRRPAWPVCPRTTAPTARRPGRLLLRTATGYPVARRGPARGAVSRAPGSPRCDPAGDRCRRRRKPVGGVAARPNSGPAGRSTRAARSFRYGPQHPGCTAWRRRSPPTRHAGEPPLRDGRWGSRAPCRVRPAIRR